MDPDAADLLARFLHDPNAGAKFLRRAARLRDLRASEKQLTLQARDLQRELVEAWRNGTLHPANPMPLPTPWEVLAAIRRAIGVDDPAANSSGLVSLESDELFVRLEQQHRIPWRHLALVEHALPRLATLQAELRVAFWSDQMCERGTEVALFDYADAAERHLGASAFILYDANAHNNYEGAIDKFRRRFGPDRVIGVAGWKAADAELAALGVSHVYAIKCNNDNQVSRLPKVKTCIHAVFDAAGEPYGDVYAKISPCVPGRGVPVVPHIIRPAHAEGPDLRRTLGIPEDGTVFGRYGGYESFDVECAREAVLEIAAPSATGPASRIYFIFMNTPPLCEDGFSDRIIHVPRTSDDETKARFIRTCDAMLHARSSGETFGLSVGEFSAHNRPILTSREHTDNGIASFHLDTLGAQAGAKSYFYSTKAELVQILTSFDRGAVRRGDHNAYRAFEPAAVMKLFEKTFLSAKAKPPLPDWKRWGHRGKAGGAAAKPRSSSALAGGDGDMSARRAEAEAEWRRQWGIQEALGRLRGLPAEEEVPATPGARFRVVSDSTTEERAVRTRLAPSISAAAVGSPLQRGAVVPAYATRGAWIRVDAQQPRWVLVSHPEHGELLQLVDVAA